MLSNITQAIDHPKKLLKLLFKITYMVPKLIWF